MADRPNNLDDGALAAIASAAPPTQAIMLLTGQAGPLEGAGFPRDVAVLAYLAWCGYRFAAKDGVLSRMKSYEARDAYANRIRSAWAEATDARSFARALISMRRTGADLEDLHPRDALWWQQQVPTLTAPWWATSVDDVAAAAAMLISQGWLHEAASYAEANPARPLPDADPELPMEAP